MMNQLNTKINKLEKLIRENEEWKNIKVEYKNMYGDVEYKTKTVLSGAESYRTEYESLLQQRNVLTGTYFH